MNKYVKIVVLSTLAEPKTLSEIGNIWFNHRGVFYQPRIKNEIRKAIVDGILIRKKTKFYQANTEKLFPELIKEINLGDDKVSLDEYQGELNYFLVTLGKYTNKVYFNFEAIKSLTNLDQQKVVNLDLKFLLQLPLLLRFMDQKHPETTNNLIQILNLENYVRLISKQEIEFFSILEENGLTDSFKADIDQVYCPFVNLGRRDLTGFKKNLEVMELLKNDGGK